MSRSSRKKLTIDVVSEDGEELEGAFVSVLSGDFASHGRTQEGGVTFSAEFDSTIEVTAHHERYVPRTKVIKLSPNHLHLRQSMQMTDQALYSSR